MAAVGDKYEVKIFVRSSPSIANTQVGINIVHYVVDNVTGLPKGDTEIADAVSQNFGPPYKAVLTDDSGYRGVIIKKVFPLPPSGPTISTLTQGPGTRVAGEVLPTQVSEILTKLTALAGRANRGRIYFPFPAEDDSIDSVPSPAYVTALTGLEVPFFNAIAVGALPDITTLLPIVFHRATPATTTLITGVKARTYFATQRRRGMASGSDVSPI